MCVVFLCSTVTHGNDESPLSFGVDNEKTGTVWLILKAVGKPIAGRIKQGREIGDEIIYN